ncbi:helix-turn-helix domain-containing protein [Streptomyces aurantiacus]|uniref:helix-turn-helix domain-containing protein n=1 Tax=Streptomyces aurantiacus TaxID=47760 RepID=UPI0027D76F99|nr:helix-turn-helix transcriptional regulator [Streptomyces aurantiacus]
MLESNNFGAMLRQWRDRTTPGQAGVRSIGRRRVPGLRREELGQLAGVSADYIKRLEQGQGHPSREVLEALAGLCGWAAMTTSISACSPATP